MNNRAEPLKLLMFISQSEIPHFPSMHALAAKVSPATSIMAETFVSPEEVAQTTETDSDFPAGLDEFTSRLSADDARVLVDLLKLAVANRVRKNGRETLSNVLTSLATSNPSVSSFIALTLFIVHVFVLIEINCI